MIEQHRFVLRELRPRAGLTAEIGRATGLGSGEILVLVRDLNDRLRDHLGLSADPIEVTASGTWRIDGIAGLVRLASTIELEVVPKFLDPTSPTWRMDFFVLAVLVRTGRLLSHDQISSSPEDRGALATLVAQSLLIGHEENERRPIRRYAPRVTADFAIDGDPDWQSVVLPSADGFELSRLELTRQNPHNAILLRALEVLAPEVLDLDTQARLNSRARKLRPQSSRIATSALLPSRAHSWQMVYELSELVVAGFGLDLRSGVYSGPGFVVSTWLAWQQLCEHVVSRAMPSRQFSMQRPWRLGSRPERDVTVTPDISVLGDHGPVLLIDAKYKARLDVKPAITSGDLYESLAFLRATNTASITLLYPSLADLDELPTGRWRLFDRVEVGDVVVEAAEVQVQGLALRSGLTKLITESSAELEGRLALSQLIS